MNKITILKFWKPLECEECATTSNLLVNEREYDEPCYLCEPCALARELETEKPLFRA